MSTETPAVHPGWQIGPWNIPPGAVLAPMAGVTDRPFRILCRSLGARLAASEMVTADTRHWNSRKSRQRMNHEGEPEPRVVQLAGHDPLQLAEAARLNADLGAQIIDINMGCPAKKVFGKSCGSALLGDEVQVGRILETVARQAGVPVTVKIRTGIDRQHINAANICRIAAQSGVAAIAIHGRTRADFYNGAAEYDTLREVCAEVMIPIIANGDIDSAHKARSVLAFTGAAAIMIGRAAHGSPWIFREVNSFLENGKVASPLLRSQKRDLILQHLEQLYVFHGETDGVRIARKHIGWYCQPHEFTQSYRPPLMAAENSSAQFALVSAVFGRWAEQHADATDAEFGHGETNLDHQQDSNDPTAITGRKRSPALA